MTMLLITAVFTFVIVATGYISHGVGRHHAPSSVKLREFSDKLEKLEVALKKEKSSRENHANAYSEYHNAYHKTFAQLQKLQDASRTWTVSYVEKPAEKISTEKIWNSRIFCSSVEMNCKNICEELKAFENKEIILSMNVVLTGYRNIDNIFNKEGHSKNYTLEFSGPAKRVANDVESHFKAQSFPLVNSEGKWVTNDIFKVICTLTTLSVKEQILPITHKVEVPIFINEVKEIIALNSLTNQKDNSTEDEAKLNVIQKQTAIDPKDPAFMAAVEIAVAELQGRGKSMRRESVAESEVKKNPIKEMTLSSYKDK